MAVPFSLGKILDIIYTSSSDMENARTKLNSVCGILVCVFLLGAICNFGRIYLMSTAGDISKKATMNSSILFSSL